MLKKYPKIILQTSADNSPSVILNGAADLVVSEENFSESQLIKEKLLGIRRGLFASPEYLEENGTPKKTSDLKNHNCILNNRAFPDNCWAFPGGKKIPIRSSFIVNTGLTTIQAAIAGIGIMWCPELVVSEEVAAGKLVEIKLENKPLIIDAYLYHRPARNGSNTKLIADHLKAAFGQ